MTEMGMSDQYGDTRPTVPEVAGQGQYGMCHQEPDSGPEEEIVMTAEDHDDGQQEQDDGPGTPTPPGPG